MMTGRRPGNRVFVWLSVAGAVALIAVIASDRFGDGTSSMRNREPTHDEHGIGIQLGGRAIWPRDPADPRSSSPSAAVAAFVVELTGRESGIVTDPDPQAGITDPTWVDVKVGDRAVTRILVVPNDGGYWAILQIGEATLSTRAARQISFPPVVDGVRGVLAWGSPRTETVALDSQSVRAGVFESREPMTGPFVVAVLDDAGQLLSVYGKQ